MVGVERRWSTLEAARTVVVAVHTVTTLMRLLDIVRVLEADARVQVVFTRVPDQLGDGVDWWLKQLGVKEFPWDEVPKETFDLALSASLHELGALQAPRLVVPHGAGFIKLWPAWAREGRDRTRQTYGLDDLSLLDEHGEVLPQVLVLPHLDNMATVERQCPEALPVAVVAGDPCYDSLLASVRYRELYRQQLGVRPAQKLVVLASTWGRQSLLGARLDLFTSLLSTIPADHRVVAMLHPAVWSEHGERQVLAWLARARMKGLDLIVPGSDWRGVLVAADWLISDHSSLGSYGAAIGVPLTIGHYPVDEIDAESVMARLAEVSPRWDTDTPAAQLAAAVRAQPRAQQVAADGVSSFPGRSLAMLRKIMYDLMRLPEPAEPPEPAPVLAAARPRLMPDDDVYR